VPRCRYLVIVDDIEYYLALAFCDAFGVHDLPGVASWGKTVLHYNVTDWRFGVIALGTCIAERRWGLAGDLHAAVRRKPPLGKDDGPPARTPLAQIRVGVF